MKRSLAKFYKLEAQKTWEVLYLIFRHRLRSI
jgi:hypothetical protein